VLLGGVACDRVMPQRDDITLPPIEAVQAIYAARGGVTDVAYSGNVVEVRAVQPWDQLRRGGTLWAQLGPYIYVFSPATREVFQEWPGIAAVRAVTVAEDGNEIARAMLLRDRFDAQLWRRTLNLLGHALQDGTRDPAHIESLIIWGERHTDYEYNPRFVPRPGMRGGE
jgi:hypothetical protein